MGLPDKTRSATAQMPQADVDMQDEPPSTRATSAPQRLPDLSTVSTSQQRDVPHATASGVPKGEGGKLRKLKNAGVLPEDATHAHLVEWRKMTKAGDAMAGGGEMEVDGDDGELSSTGAVCGDEVISKAGGRQKARKADLDSELDVAAAGE